MENGRSLLRSLAVVLLALSGCTASVLKVRVSAPADKPPPVIEVLPVTCVPGETKLQNVGTFEVGAYEDADCEALRKTFQKSAEQFLGAGGHRVHVILRRVLIAHTNNMAFACACVAWAIQAPDGALVFHEQFYAWDMVRLLGTVGGVKDGMHEALVRRILETSLRVAAGGVTPVPDPERTSTDFEAAKRALPSSFRLVESLMLQCGGYTFFIPIKTTVLPSEVTWVRQPGHVDWPAVLQGK